MAEFVAGKGTTALGIIGTVLGSLGVAGNNGMGLNLFGNGTGGCSEDHVVNRYEATQQAKIAELETKVAEIEAKGIATCDAIVTQGKDAVVSAGKKVATTVGNIARPYGEVAKGQLSEAGVRVKGFANNGTKKLIKLLEKVEDKTSNK